MYAGHGGSENKGYERQGVKGSLVLSQGVVDVELTLGMMLTPMKGQIEAEVNKQLDRYFG